MNSVMLVLCVLGYFIVRMLCDSISNTDLYVQFFCVYHSHFNTIMARGNERFYGFSKSVWVVDVYNSELPPLHP